MAHPGTIDRAPAPPRRRGLRRHFTMGNRVVGQESASRPSSVWQMVGNAVGRRYMALPLTRLLRPRQWIKNGVVAAALVFADRLSHPSDVGITAAAVIAFCAVSSSGYIVNDLIDVKRDRRHPLKRLRPIAAGQVSPGLAVSLAAVLLAFAMVISLAIRPGMLLVTGVYALVTGSYSF